MTWRFYALMVMGLGLAANATDADARWNRSENCKAVLEGAAIGKGILGLGSERARGAARDNWEGAVEGSIRSRLCEPSDWAEECPVGYC